MSNISILGLDKRLSNIEALRLLSMLMVLNLHSFWGYGQNIDMLNVLDFFRNSTSICAVNVFLVISGYFGIKWKFKSFFNLTFQILFYSFGVYAVAVLLGAVEFTISGVIECAKCMYASWGFITGYVLLYFCAPLLNAFVEKVSSKELFYFMIIFYVAELFICRNNSYLNYSLMYLIGKFLNKTNAVETLKINAGRAYWITTLVIFVCVYTLDHFVGVNTAEAMCSNLVGYSYSGPFVILQAVFLFLAFARMRFRNSYINWFSSSCLSIFLIHMHPVIKDIGYYSFTKSFYNQPPFFHIGAVAVLIFIVFFGCILIDKIRIFVSSVVYGILLRIKNELLQQCCERESYLPLRLKNIL